MRKSGAKVVDTKFAKLFTPPVFWYASVAFTIFAPYLLLSFYIFATYLQEANLGKSIFRPAIYLAVYCRKKSNN